MSQLARTPKQIGAIIQRARKQRGWTQASLAEQAGLRQETISTVETGITPAKLSTVFALLAALDLEFRVTERTKGKPEDIEAMFAERTPGQAASD